MCNSERSFYLISLEMLYSGCIKAFIINKIRNVKIENTFWTSFPVIKFKNFRFSLQNLSFHKLMNILEFWIKLIFKS